MAPAPIPGWKAWTAVTRYAPRHRGQLWRGLGLTLISVALQLGVLWPMKELLEGNPSAAWRSYVPSWLTPRAVLCTGFFVMMVLAGLFDYLQRVAFARFGIGWARDLRAAADRTSQASGDSLHRGELVARLIADVARFKASVKVTLVYVASNSVLFLVGSLLVWSIHASFGLLFTVAFLLAVGVAWIGARRSFGDYSGYREQEGLLAQSLSSEGSMERGELDESGAFEASEIRQQSGAAWFAHGIVGAMVAAILILGGRGLEDGSIAASTLLLFLGYALFLSKPLVRLTRHGARVGKVLAGGLRLGSFLAAAEREQTPALTALEQSLCVDDGSLRVELPARGVVRVEGPGARRWLQALFMDSETRPRVLWDGEPVGPGWLTAHTARVPRRPTWTVPSLSGLLESLAGTDFEPCLAGLHLPQLARARRGLALASGEVSRGEAVAVALARAAAAGLPLLLIERADEGLDEAGLAALSRWVAVAGKSALVLVRTGCGDWLPEGVRVLEPGRDVQQGEPSP